METYDAIPVTFQEEGGSRWPEPPLDESWDDLTKLRWQAGCVFANTGIVIRISTPGYYIRDEPVADSYSFNIGRSSISSFTLRSGWTYLNGVQTGALQAREQDAATVPA